MADAPPTLPDATPTPPVAPTTPSAWDKFVSAVAKPWAVIGTRQQTDKEKARANGPLGGFIVNPLGATLRAAPNMVRPGSIGATDYSNRPVIQVLSDTDATSHTTAPSFSDFILTNVTGGDAEKAEVIETFGIPHVFTSGRFMRRYTFNLSVRTTQTEHVIAGVSPSRAGGGSRGNNQYRRLNTITHYAAFLRFYDDFLRVTKQAETGRFTRITVDGEVMDGWVLSMTPNRDSGSEGFANITFTMVVRDRAHPGQAAELTRYLKQFAAAPKTAKPKRRAQLNAELVAATGFNEMTTTLLKEPKVTAAGFYPLLKVSLKTQGPLRADGELAGTTVGFDRGRPDVVLNGGQEATVGITVTDITKFTGGSVAIKLIAGQSTKTVNAKVTADLPRADPGTIRGAARGAPAPYAFSNLTSLAEIPFSLLSAGAVTFGLDFSKTVPAGPLPTLGATGTVEATLADGTERSVALTLRLREEDVQKLVAGTVPSITTTVTATGGAYTLPTFSVKFLSQGAALTPRRAFTDFTAVMASAGDVIWELQVQLTNASSTSTETAIPSHNIELGVEGAKTKIVFPLAGGRGSLPISSSSAATVRALVPVTNGTTITQRILVFHQGAGVGDPLEQGTIRTLGRLKLRLLADAPYIVSSQPALVDIPRN
jgi:hypothetical protein